jgi:hypothetical protein
MGGWLMPQSIFLLALRGNNLNFSNLKEGDESVKYGFSVHFFLDSFNKTFYKSSMNDFECFFKENNNINKWMIFSDYALYDKTKKNDVITFSIVPYIIDFNHFSEHLKKIAPGDLKNSRKVNDNFLKFLEIYPIFNIAIVLDKKRKLHDNEKQYFLTKFEMMVGMLEKWCETTPENKIRYIEQIKKLNLLINVINGSGANLKVIRDIEIVSTLAAYIMFEITKLVSIETIGWFSDRDIMLSYKAVKSKSSIIFDMINNLYYIFCNDEGIDYKDKLVFGVPENTGSVWYDSFNRIPDLISGTLADYDYKNNECSHDKFIPVIERLFTLSNKNIFFNITFSKKEYSVSRLAFQNKKC